MTHLVLIAFCAGAASLLLFATLTSGSPFALALAQIAPLPILIAGLGWSHWCAILALLLAGASLAAYFGAFFAFVFIATVGLPAWWLSYLALLARPGSDKDTLEWYPAGRLVAWACLLGAVVTVIGIVKIGSGEQGFEATLRMAFERFLRLQAGAARGQPLELPGVSDTGRFLDLLVLVIPPAAAGITALVNLMNLWLAGRAVELSHRLRRPWPDLAAFRLPPTVAGVLALLIAGSFLPDLAGAVCRALAAGLGIAFVMLGLAVLHTLTRPLKSRLVVLTSAYVLVALLQWPVLLVLALGIAEALGDIRTRFAAARDPA